jgi:hypothetical protein
VRQVGKSHGGDPGGGGGTVQVPWPDQGSLSRVSEAPR